MFVVYTEGTSGRGVSAAAGGDTSWTGSCLIDSQLHDPNAPPSRRAPFRERWAADLVPDFAAGLSEPTWTMLHLIYFAGFTQRQVAEELHIRETEVSTAVARGMQIVGGMVSAPA